MFTAGSVSNVNIGNLTPIGNNSDEVEGNTLVITLETMEKEKKSTLAEPVSENMITKESKLDGEGNVESETITLELDKDKFTETREYKAANAKNKEVGMLHRTGNEIGVIEKQDFGERSVDSRNHGLSETNNENKTNEVTESGGASKYENIKSNVTRNRILDVNKRTTMQGNSGANTENEEANTPHEIRNPIGVTEVPKSNLISTSQNDKSITTARNETLHKDKESEVQQPDNTSSGKESHVATSDEDGTTEAARHCKISGEGSESEASMSSPISELPFNCDTCKITFTSGDSMKLHLNEMHLRYKCFVCSKIFFEEFSLKAHCLRSHPHLKLCVLCKNKANSKSSLLQHYRTTHGQIINESKTWRCKKCIISIPTEEAMQQHFEELHKVEGSSCPICHGQFLGTDEVVDHMKSLHVRVITETSCTICKLVCGNVIQQILHYLEHHGDYIQKHLVDQKFDCVTLGLFDRKSEGFSHNTNVSPSGNDTIFGSDEANKENDYPGPRRRSSDTGEVVAETETESKPCDPQESNNQNICDISHWSLRCRFCFEPFGNRHLRESHESKRHPKQLKKVINKAKAKKTIQSNPCVTTCPICKKVVKSEGSLEHHAYAKHPVIKLKNGSAVLLETVIREESHLNHYECHFCGNLIIKNIATIRNHFEKDHSDAVSDAASMGLFDEDPEDAPQNATAIDGESMVSKNASRGVYDTPDEHDKALRSGEMTKVDECLLYSPSTSSNIDLSCQDMSKRSLRSNEFSSYNLSGPSNRSLHSNDTIHRSGKGSADDFHEDNSKLHGKNNNRKEGERVWKTGQEEATSGAIWCPMCNWKCKSEETFLQHARMKHPAIKLGDDPAVPLEKVLTTLYEDEKTYYKCPFTSCLHSSLKVHNVTTHIYKSHEDKTYLMSDCVSLRLFDKETGSQISKNPRIAFCPICKKTSTSEKGVIEHAAYKHPAIKLENAPPLPLTAVLRTQRIGRRIYYECPFCTYTSPGINSVTYHILKKHKDRANQMSDCVSLGLFGDAPEESISRFTWCPICKGDYNSFVALRDHARNKHPAIKLQNGSTVLLETILKDESYHLDHYECPYCGTLINKNISAVRYHFEREHSGAISDGVLMGLFDKDSDSGPQNASIRESVNPDENDGVSRSDEMETKNECLLYNLPTSSIVGSNYQDRSKHILRSGGTSSYNFPGPSSDNFYEDNKLENQQFNEPDCKTMHNKEIEQIWRNKEVEPALQACPICKKGCKSEKDILQHATIKHPAIKLGNDPPIPLEAALTTLYKEDKIYYKCPFAPCIHSFSRVQEVSTHIVKRHKDKAHLLSDFVSLGLFDEQASSQVPENTAATQAVPYVRLCPLCNRTFSSEKGLRLHATIKHPAIKLGDSTPVPLETALTTLCEDGKIYYKCPFASCVHSFLCVQDVVKHISRRHKDLAYQLSDCLSLGLFEKDPVSSPKETCSKISANPGTKLLPHVRLCPICRKVFKSDEALRKHTKSKHPITKLENKPPVPLEPYNSE